MVKEQIIARGIKDEKVISAMLKVKRHEFVPKEFEDEAYSDYPLAIGSGQTISQPYIVALMTEQLELKKTDRVLEIGTGSGYQAAILSEIANEVVTVERISELSENAKKHLSKYKNLKIVIGNGKLGWKENAPYDAIIVTAAANEIPLNLIEQLNEGGRIVIPISVDGFFQKLMQYKKINGKLEEKYICDVTFVPLI